MGTQRLTRPVIGDRGRAHGLAVLACGLAVSAGGAACGQSMLQEWCGPPTLSWGNDSFGSVFELLPDVDGDGIRDLVIGAPLEDQVKRNRQDGSVHVVSGSTGAIIRSHVGGKYDQLGTDVAVLDDVDGDGVADYSGIGSAFGLRDVVTVWSGQTGAMIWQVVADATVLEWFIGVLTVVSDLDSDGVNDLAVAAYQTFGLNPGNRLTVFSATTGARLADWMGNGLGRVMSACRLDDLNGDGIVEFAVGHQSGRGQVEVVDGATLGILATIFGDPTSGVSFADRCGQVGDLDGDGVRDLIISDQNFGSYGTTLPPDGRVYLYSGATFLELYHLDPPQPHDPIGYGFVAEQSDFDFNGDGWSDFAIGCIGPAPSTSTADGMVACCTSCRPISRCRMRDSGARCNSKTGTVTGSTTFSMAPSGTASH
jgi:FG-GAP repeat